MAGEMQASDFGRGIRNSETPNPTPYIWDCRTGPPRRNAFKRAVLRCKPLNPESRKLSVSRPPALSTNNKTSSSVAASKSDTAFLDLSFLQPHCGRLGCTDFNQDIERLPVQALSWFRPCQIIWMHQSVIRIGVLLTGKASNHAPGSTNILTWTIKVF